VVPNPSAILSGGARRVTEPEWRGAAMLIILSLYVILLWLVFFS
jgi:hypothetical protein